MRERVVMADAGFEAALGIILLIGALIGDIDGRDFADPATTAVVVAFGAALLALGFGLSSATSRGLITRQFLLVLGATNAGFAVLLVIWALIGDAFSTQGSVLTWITALVLLLLAAVQWRLAASAPTRPPRAPPR
jgi:hypothetical protein